MIAILALALMGQPRDDIAELAASYHRRAWELAGQPTTAQICERFNAAQVKPFTPPPAPIPWAEMERRAWAGWLFRERWGIRLGRCE